MSNIDENRDKIFLVGAGAGNKDHLTIKAYELIKSADIIIYDRLIDQSIIDLFPEQAEKIFAGKEPDKHHMTQDEINQKMVDLYSQGKKIIRLKGGDPFIFGRAGEEAEFLKKHNIPCEIVPAISAFQLATSEYLIPTTLRGIADGFSVISGHKYDDAEPNIDYKSLVSLNHTIIIYMGVGNVEIIANRLIEAGMPKSTACFIGEKIGSKESKSLFSELVNFADDIKTNNIKNPALIIIGDVVANSKNEK
jgi:uroporphyrin-III C-methyltransferase